MKNIYAYTADTNPYPGFVSLNQWDEKIILAVRESAKPGPFSDKDCGNSVEITLPRSELPKLFEALRNELTPP